MPALHQSYNKPLGGYTTDKRWLIFGGFVFIWLLHHYFVFLGFYNNDDIIYAKYANQLLNGEEVLSLPDRYALRWSAIAATAFFYKLFGYSEAGIYAFGLINLLLCALLLMRILRTESESIVILALILFFGNYSLLFASHRLLPDSGVCMAVFAAFFCYYQSRRKETGNAWWGLGFATFNMLAVMTKETIILVAPLYLWLFVMDIRQKRNRSFWTVAFAGAVFMIGLYLFYFKQTTGSWLFRFKALTDTSYLSECSFDVLPAVETVKRIAYLLWNEFLLNGDMLFILPGVMAFVYRKKLTSSSLQRLIIDAGFILVLSANFMSISFTEYLPLCQDPRHFMFVMPFMAIAGAWMFNAFAKEPARYSGLVIAFAVATVIMFVQRAGEMKYVYLLLSLLLAGWWLVKWMRNLPSTIFIAGLLMILLIRPMFDIVRRANSFYFDHKKMVRELPDRDRMRVLTGDDITAELSEFFRGFRKERLTFQNLKRNDTLGINNNFVLVNRATTAGFAEELEAIEQEHQDKVQLVAKYGEVALYRIDDRDIIQRLKSKVVY